MAGVIGPNSYLPGQILPVPKDMMCDDHEDRLATRRIVGESDSFGSEMIDWCDECYDNYQKHKHEHRSGMCAWCKQHATDLRPTRDYDEGSCGPIYDVCGSCRRKASERATEEMKDHLPEYDFDDDSEVY